MSGYHALPDLTAAAIRRGWLMTGDLGYLDDDGNLHYVGRSKEMIKTGGFSVDPAEVEHAILTMAAVDAAAVIGVHDDHWGEKVIAFVAPVERRELGAAEVIAACRELIADYKVPKEVIFVGALPVNATGKVERSALRKSYDEARGA
jgi:acyl-CoA synthetase (AMP-forming)/AMP-acid ligase II